MTQIYLSERERERAISGRTFSLKFDIRPIKYKIHSVQVDIYHLKGIKIKKIKYFKVSLFMHPWA